MLQKGLGENMNVVGIKQLWIWLLFGFGILMGCDNSQAASESQQISGKPTPEQLLELEANTTLATAFGVPNSKGNFSPSLNTIHRGSVKNQFENGYAYELRRDGTAFSAQVGLLPQNDLGALPMSGFATLRGEYQILQTGKSDNVREFGGVSHTTGMITLRANFNFGTLTGAAGDLIVDGTFKDKALSGNVFFQQRKAEMRGLIGTRGAVGVFHNTNDKTALVGGFSVTP